MTQENSVEFGGFDAVVGLGCFVGMPICIFLAAVLLRQGYLLWAILASASGGAVARLLLSLTLVKVSLGERAWRKLWTRTRTSSHQLGTILAGEPTPRKQLLHFWYALIGLVIYPCWPYMLTAFVFALLWAILMR